MAYALSVGNKLSLYRREQGASKFRTENAPFCSSQVGRLGPQIGWGTWNKKKRLAHTSPTCPKTCNYCFDSSCAKFTRLWVMCSSRETAMMVGFSCCGAFSKSRLVNLPNTPFGTFSQFDGSVLSLFPSRHFRRWPFGIAPFWRSHSTRCL